MLTKLFPLLLYGKTFWLVSFFFTILITSFSQYTTICFVSFVYSVFNEHFLNAEFRMQSAKWILLVGPSGLEPPTSCLSGTRSNLLSYEPMWLVWLFAHLGFGGDDGIRTHDPLLAGQVLSQLSYTPIVWGFCFFTFFQDRGTVLSVPCPVSALSYLPVQLPAKYFRHCRA